MACVFGVLSGFQGVYQRFKADAFGLSFNRWGLFYLALRGSVPAIFFGVIYWQGLLNWHPAFLALALGISFESVLRLQLFVKKTPDGKDFSISLFEFVQQFERIFMNQIQEVRARQQQDLAERVAPKGVAFPTLCQSVRARIKLSPDEEQTALTKVMDSIFALYEKDSSTGKDDSYAVMLALEFAAHVSQKELERLLRQPTPAAPGA